ncbi:MAG TPA: DUF4350 domain-containing protein [Candidatus Acidoferrales bacterium]|nr:DUF4350 domain-containing protein [Candidatus Acidoferrales bacterium]
MPVGIAAGDKKILLIGGGLLVLLLTSTAILSPPEQQESPIPSTYSAQSKGAEAAYTLLLTMHYPVRRWEDPPTDLKPKGDALLILADPFLPPSKQERDALADFVEDGGRVLFTGENIRLYFPGASIEGAEVVDARTIATGVPSPLARGAQRIEMKPEAYWGKISESQLGIYEEADGPVVVRWAIGDGELLWWASPLPLSNAGITRESNLQFFLNCVGSQAAGEPYEIYWDEFYHGQRSSLWSYVQKTSLAWGAAQFGILALAIVFTFSRRSGPTYVPRGVSRLSPLEFVDTLGGLYERAGAAPAAVGISYQRLRTLLARQLGFSANTPSAELAQAAEQRLGWEKTDVLQRAEAARRAEKIEAREALELVRELEQSAAKLDLRARFRLEKK